MPRTKSTPYEIKRPEVSTAEGSRSAIDYLKANCVDFPDRAGELQRAGATAGLIRELGDNYSRYHQALQERLETLGGDANPADFPDDPASYGRLANALQRIATTEVLLRRARAHRKQGHPLNAQLKGAPPLWDADHRLVDVEHPEQANFRGPLERAPSVATSAPKYPSA